MEWSDNHDLVLCREVLVTESYQHPFRSKERGDVWNQITVNLSGLDHLKFKVNKRSMRDSLTLLITMHKAKIRQEENVTGITCEDQTKLSKRYLTGEVGRRKKLRGKEKTKGRRSSSRGTQAECYETFRADREKTF